jgi:hypothetical protein
MASGVGEATLDVSSEWDEGYCANVIITNHGSTNITDWTVALNLNASTVYTIWSANLKGNTVTPLSHNATVLPGGMVNFGFCANGTNLATLSALSVEGGGVSSITRNASLSSNTIFSSSSFSNSLSNSSGELELVVAINAGGQATSYTGVAYQADNYSNGGRVSSTTDSISGTSEDTIFQSERYGSFSYKIPVAAAAYSINMHFAEIFHESAGKRSFNLYVEDNLVMSSVDLYALVGHDSAYTLSVENVAVTDGELDIRLETQMDNATIAGFEVYSEKEDQDDGVPPPPPGDGPNTMGFIGCSMAENTASGYRAVGGQRMWAPYGTGGDVVQNWTNTNSAAWNKFDQQVATYGRPSAVWVQLCVFSYLGVTDDEVRSMIANAREHAAPDATIYITGQPLYEDGWTCFLAGSDGPLITDQMARQAGADPSLNVIYAGTFGPLGSTTTSDSCHANSSGERLLGEQAMRYFGQ